MAEFNWHNRGRGSSMCISDAVSHVMAEDDRTAKAMLSQSGMPPQPSSVCADSTRILAKARKKIREADECGMSLSLCDAVTSVEMEEQSKGAPTLAASGAAAPRGVAFEAMQLLSDARKRIQKMKAVGLSLSVSDAISMADATAPEAFTLLSKAGALIQASAQGGRKLSLAEAMSAVGMAHGAAG
jgi:hypothetical protein